MTDALWVALLLAIGAIIGGIVIGWAIHRAVSDMVGRWGGWK